MSDPESWRYQWPDGTWIRWNQRTQSWEKEPPGEQPSEEAPVQERAEPGAPPPPAELQLEMLLEGSPELLFDDDIDVPGESLQESGTELDNEIVARLEELVEEQARASEPVEDRAATEPIDDRREPLEHRLRPRPVPDREVLPADALGPGEDPPRWWPAILGGSLLGIAGGIAAIYLG